MNDWPAVKAELASSFAAFLGQELVPVWEPHYQDIRPGWGFSFGVRSAAPLGGPLRLEFYAVVSADYDLAHVEATVLLFAGDHRLTGSFPGEVLLYSRHSDPVGWRCDGWANGECSEWEGYQRLSQIGVDLGLPPDMVGPGERV